MKWPKKLSKYIAEFIGTFALVFFGTGAIVVNHQTGGALGHLAICLVFGLIVLAVIYSIGHISGAHLNPAVTLGFAASGRLPWDEVLPFIITQLLAAAAGSGVLKLLLPGSGHSWAMTLPGGTALQSAGLEFVLTFMLMFIIMGVATDARAQGVMAGVAVGGYIALAALVGGPISGASMNPARSLGPALINLDFTAHWLYWIFPILGSVLGALTYRWVQCPTGPGEKGNEQGCC